MKKNKQDEKSIFFKRFAAFILDTLLVAFVSSLIASPFVDVSSVEKLTAQMQDVSNSYIENKIDSSTYLAEYSSITYQLSRKNGIINFVTIFQQIAHSR